MKAPEMTRQNIPQPPPFAPATAKGSALPPPQEANYEELGAPDWNLRRDASSALISMITHMLIVIVAALVQFEVSSPSGVFLEGILDGGGNEGAGLGAIDTGLTGEGLEQELNSAAEAALSASASDTSAIEKLLASAPPTSGGSLDEEIREMLASSGGDPGGGSGGGSGNLGGLGPGFGPGEGASFFGLGAKGKRFVFVIDSSSSMWGARWIEVRKELIAALKKLDKTQSFHVICFDLEPIPLTQIVKKPKLTPATPESIAALDKALRAHTLGRGTFGANAMSEALQLKPDAIYLLTDGEFQDDVAGLLRTANTPRSNRKRTPVHVVSFHNEIAAERLMYMARENKGTFRFVAEDPSLPVMPMPAQFIGSGERVLPPQEYLKGSPEQQ